MTMIQTVNEKIEDITDLKTLKKYTCLKNMHKPEWYLECVDCKGKDHCRAGKQAIFLLNQQTASEKTNILKVKPDGRKKDRAEVEGLFSSEDPIRKLLESSNPSSKSQSLYSKVYIWEKQFPDLKDRYHMREKMTFLMKKPYDRMTVGEVLDDLYPKKEEPVMKETERDDISLEEFLSETEVQSLAKTAKNRETEIKEEQKYVIPIPPKRFPAENPKVKDIQKDPDGECGKMDQMLAKLEAEKKTLHEKLEMIDKQIEAIRIVQNLIG